MNRTLQRLADRVAGGLLMAMIVTFICIAMGETTLAEGFFLLWLALWTIYTTLWCLSVGSTMNSDNYSNRKKDQ